MTTARNRPRNRPHPRLVRRTDLAPHQKRQMFQLLEAYFEGPTFQGFETDLAGKNWALLVEDDESSIVGFTTFAMYRTSFQGQSMSVVCSGDTIVDRSQPPCTALLRGWINSVLLLHSPRMDEPLCWLLIVSGFRTYRMLPVFFSEFWPRHEETTPPAARGLLDHLAFERYGECYDRSTGIVRLAPPEFPGAQVLRGDLAAIPAGRRRDDHIEFFARANPGHAAGDELACLAHISVENLTAAGRRMLDANALLVASGCGA